MAESPEERLARLRREVEATTPGSATPPESARPSPSALPSASGGTNPAADPASAMPTTRPEPSSVPSSTAAPPSRSTALPDPDRPAPEPAHDGDGWSLAEAIGGATLGQWVAIGLVALGGYLLLAQIVPGVSFGGSLVMAVAGVVLLWLHFAHRLGSWALYAGAVLAAVGILRVAGDLVPFALHGETALGVGIAFLAIGYLRNSQAGGYGWQGILGGVALAWGALQLALGLLPGAPGVLDLVVPVVILVAGIWLLIRTMGPRGARRGP